MLSDNNKNKPDSGFFTEKITVPWLIVTIFSMISFLAFLISIFFGVFILAIASVVLLDGIHKKKENYISGNLNFIMFVLCIICAVIVMNM